MNLKLIDAAIADYREALDAGDVARLDFFRALWGALDDCTRELGEDGESRLPAYAAPDAGTVKRLCVIEQPVLREAPVSVNAALLADCMDRLVAVVAERGVFSEDAVRALQDTSWDTVIAADAVEAAGSDPSAWLEDLVERLSDDGMEPDCARLAGLLASLALRVQLERPAQAIMQARSKVANIGDSHPLLCPVCGSAPMMGHVGALTSSSGRGRVLVCPQCLAVWEFDRVRCARCGTRNQAHLHFYSLEGDDAHRLEVCDECGGYLRILYSDDALAMCSYEVEDVVMAKLDELSRDPRVSKAEA